MKYDEEELNLAIEKGTKAWADVPDISEWVSEQRGRTEMRYSRRYKCPHCGVKGRLGINPERVQRCRQCGNGFLLEEAFHKEQPKGSGFLERKPNPAINNFQI